MSMSLLHWRAQKWPLHSSCGLHSAESRGRITSFDLMIKVYLTKRRRMLTYFVARANFWLMFKLVCIRTPGPFLPSCFPVDWLTACTGAWGHSCPSTGLCISPCWTFWGSCQPISTACQTPFVWQHSCPQAACTIDVAQSMWYKHELSHHTVQNHHLS